MNAKPTKTEGFDKALAALHASFALQDSWRAAERSAVETFGKGPLTSGLGHASLADDATKAHLRALIRSSQDAMDASLQAWRDCGRQARTWRAFRDYARKVWDGERV